jgi:hypothetical protein
MKEQPSPGLAPASGNGQNQTYSRGTTPTAPTNPTKLLRAKWKKSLRSEGLRRPTKGPGLHGKIFPFGFAQRKEESKSETPANRQHTSHSTDGALEFLTTANAVTV